LLEDVVHDLSEPDDVIRPRSAHASEIISRTNQEVLLAVMPRLIDLVTRDPVPIVRWHLAMLFGNIRLAEEAGRVISTLFRLLEDESVFVRASAIASLCLLGKRDRRNRARVIRRIKALQDDRGIAIRTRIRKVLDVLENESKPVPAG